MSVIVKDMKMPKSCGTCWLNHYNTQWMCWVCNVTHRPLLCRFEERIAECPLIEIPTEHGRLIDADKTIDDYVNYGVVHSYDVHDLQDILDEVPVVVPAEKGGAE